MPKVLPKSGVALLIATASAFAQTDLRFNMPKGATDISADVFGLHMLIFWVCVGIGAIVFGVMFYSIIKLAVHRVIPATVFVVGRLAA
jgi:cytochrome c oxidase subunit II